MTLLELAIAATYVAQAAGVLVILGVFVAWLGGWFA